MRSTEARPFLLAALAVVLSSAVARADEPAMPPTFQAVLFQKILSYDRTHKAGSPILLVPPDGQVPLAEQIQTAMADAGLVALILKATALGTAPRDADVAYFWPETSTEETQAFCAERGILSLSAAVALTVGGKVSVSVGTKVDGKPKIVVNLSRMKTEGHSLSADLLRLSTVIF